MKAKELRERLGVFPDDTEIFLFDPEWGEFIPIKTIQPVVCYRKKTDGCVIKPRTKKMKEEGFVGLVIKE